MAQGDVILDEHTQGHSAQNHFINAVEFMHIAAGWHDESVRLWRCHRLALASILEAFVGIECEINEIGHSYLFDKSSQHYVSEDPANIPFELFRRNWDKNVPLIEKARWVLALLGGKLEGRMEARLRELLVLRNWLVHGFMFRSTYLMEEVDEYSSSCVDREDSVKWNARFPNLKFNAPDALATSDAQVAVRVAFEFLHVIRTITGTVEHIVYVKDGVPRFYEARAGANIEELIMGSSPSLAEVAAACR